MPFSFEGAFRKRQSEEGLQELKKHVDSITIMNNDEVMNPDVGYREALNAVDDMAFEAIKRMIEAFKG